MINTGGWLEGWARMTDDSVDRIVDDLDVRLARMPWTRFHARIMLAVCVLWVLAGAAVGAVAAIGPAGPDSAGVGTAAALYLTGEVLGVVVGGALTRRTGRRPVLWLAALLFIAANAAPALMTGAPGSASALVAGVLPYGAVRLAAGLAAGAQYAAVLDVVRELIPRIRRTNVLITVNGLYWLGVVLGTAAQLALAQPGAAPGMPGWRDGLLVAPALALLLAGTCGLLPESPSWLARRGRADRAAAIVDVAERDARAAGHPVGRPPARASGPGRRPERGTVGTLAAMLRADRAATVRAVALGGAQGLVYGGVLFTLVPQLGAVYHLGPATAPAYLGCFALANLVGALVLGRLLDPGGQGPPFAVAYMWAGGLLALTGVLMATGIVSAWLVTLLLCAAFLIVAPVSGALIADATARYPAWLRAPAARTLYALGQLGAVPGALLFGLPLPGGHPGAVALGYVAAAVIMVVTGLIAASLRAPAAERAADTPFDDDRYAPPRPPSGAPPDAPAWSFPPPPGHDDRR